MALARAYCSVGRNGRMSFLEAGAVKKKGEILSTTVGGYSVLIGKGKLQVP